MDKLDKVVEYIVKELKVDHINISAMHPAGRAYKNFDEVCLKLTDIMLMVKKVGLLILV